MRSATPYTASASSPYIASVSSPYMAFSPSPYIASVPSPYIASVPSPYMSFSPHSPYIASVPSPHMASVPSPYMSFSPHSPYIASVPSPHMAYSPRSPYIAPVPSHFISPPPYTASPASHYIGSIPFCGPHLTSFDGPISDWDSNYFFASVADWVTLACYGWFSVLIGWDVWRAIKKRATWVPGKAFTLTGVTVQIIVWWTSLSHIENKCKKQVALYDIYVFHQIVVSGKVALCVFIGYLLPGMATPSLLTFLVLGVGICVQISSELILVYNYIGIKMLDEKWTSWLVFTNSMLFVCVIVLGSILACTILAGKTFLGLLRQRISAIFPITKTDESQSSNERKMSISWSDFEDEVLSSWLVARVCQTDYVIARSVFNSAVGIVVTFCVIIFLLSNTSFDIYFSSHDSHYKLNAMDYAILSLLFSFIIIGWIVTCFRWLSTQLYFRSHRQVWRRFVCLEDFWTRSTIELIQIYDLKGVRQRFQDDERSTFWLSMLKKLQRLPTKIFTKVKFHKLIYLLLILQLAVVFFSKFCGLMLEVIIGKFVYWLRKHMRRGDRDTSWEKYIRTLGIVCMPGEDPSDLWEANKMSFHKAKDSIDRGYQKWRSTDEINSFFQQYSLQLEDGAKLLNTLHKRAFPSVLKHFPSVEKQYVTITVVSLITILIRLHKKKTTDLQKLLKACREVWDLLSFMDECDIDLQANKISLFEDLKKEKDQICMAAEREFYKLQMEFKNLDPTCEDSDVREASEILAATAFKEEHKILKALSKECEDILKSENLLGGSQEVAVNLTDSKDWMTIAPRYSLYKLCRFMLDNSVEDCTGNGIEECVGNDIEGCAGKDIKDFVTWTENALRNVIVCCMSRLPDILVTQCWKWAQEFEEDKLWKAIDLAGKCKGVMEKWEPRPELTRNIANQWTIQDMWSA